MAWQVELVRILRHLINDLASTPTFADSRLEEVILVSAQLIQNSLTFLNTYTIDVDSCTLTPDPTTGTKDNGFINLVLLKSRCIIRESEYRSQATTSGFTVVDGPTRVSTEGSLKGYKDMWDQACKDYDKAKFDYAAGSLCPGEAILGPFSSPTLSFTSEQGRDRILYS